MKISLIDGVTIEQSYSNIKSLKIENTSEKDINIKLLFYCNSVVNAIHQWSGKIKSNTWIIPEINTLNTNYFKVLINDINKGIIPIYDLNNQIPLEEKIICLGLNKTGTSSIKKAFEDLGFKVYPQSHNDSNFLHNYFTGKNVGTAIDFMEQTNHTFFKDIPWSCPGISEKIIRYTPNSKFILSVRENPEKWINSVKRFWTDILKDGEIDYTYIADVKFLDYDYKIPIYGYLYGMFKSWNLEKYDGTFDEKLYQVYINHNNSVRKTLNKYNCDWIEIDVSKEGEHKKLTDWLGIYSDKINFEHINKTK